MQSASPTLRQRRWTVVIHMHGATGPSWQAFRSTLHRAGHASTWLIPAQVSASSSVKKVAGKLAHSAREGDPPAVLAIGADSLNQAIKVGRCFAAQCCFNVSHSLWMQAIERWKANHGLLFCCAERDTNVPVVRRTQQ